MDVKVPQLAEGISSGTVVGISVRVGDTVSAGQTILELETEKAIAPVPSPAAGKVERVLVAEGDSVVVGQTIIQLAGGAGAEAAPVQEAQPQRAAETRARPEAPQPAPYSQPSRAAGVRAMPAAAPEGFPVPASPSLRRIAAELGIDLRRVQGTGPGGRISERDVRAYVQELQRIAFTEQPPAAPVSAVPEHAAPPLPDFSKFGEISRKPLSTLRKKIAEKMAISWGNVVHVTQFDEAEMTRLSELRKKYKPVFEKKGARLTVTTLLLAAIVKVLKQHPIFNATLDLERQEIVFKEYINLGIAVDTEQGLIVPVIREADKKSILELSGAVQELAEKARTRSVSLEDLQGGSFTISNQGGIGGTHFTPVVNWPEAAILGLGQTREKALVRDGRASAVPFLPLALSYDHRLIDGGDAARFIAALVKEIEWFDEQQLNVKE